MVSTKSLRFKLKGVQGRRLNRGKNSNGVEKKGGGETEPRGVAKI